jgi:VanZ family protein
MLKKINFKYLIIIWVIIIFILSSLSGNKFNKIPIIPIPYLDKIVHFIMYFTLQFLFLLEYFKNYQEKYKRVKYLLLTLFLSISYGAILEVLQQFIFTKRSGSFYDFTANSLGTITACLIVFYLINKTRILNRIINT